MQERLFTDQLCRSNSHITKRPFYMLPVMLTNTSVVEKFSEDPEVNAEVIIAMVEGISDVTVEDGKVETSLTSSCVASRHKIR